MKGEEVRRKRRERGWAAYPTNKGEKEVGMAGNKKEKGGGQEGGGVRREKGVGGEQKKKETTGNHDQQFKGRSKGRSRRKMEENRGGIYTSVAGFERE